MNSARGPLPEADRTKLLQQNAVLPGFWVARTAHVL